MDKFLKALGVRERTEEMEVEVDDQWEIVATPFWAWPGSTSGHGESKLIGAARKGKQLALVYEYETEEGRKSLQVVGLRMGGTSKYWFRPDIALTEVEEEQWVIDLFKKIELFDQ